MCFPVLALGLHTAALHLNGSQWQQELKFHFVSQKCYKAASINKSVTSFVELSKRCETVLMGSETAFSCG